MKPRRGKVIYLQISAAVVSLLLGLFNLGKESAPIVQKMQERQIQRSHEEAAQKAREISKMQIPWQYRGNDGTWRYYSDQIGQYWCRVNIQGVYEYSENPEHVEEPKSIIASAARLIR